MRSCFLARFFALRRFKFDYRRNLPEYVYCGGNKPKKSRKNGNNKIENDPKKLKKSSEIPTKEKITATENLTKE